MLQIQPIRTDAGYKAALAAVSPLFDNEPDPDSDEGAAFDAMITLIEAYERKHYPVGPVDPIDAIKFHMEQQGLGPKDLQPMLGGLNRVYVLKTCRAARSSSCRPCHFPGVDAASSSLLRDDPALLPK